MISGGFHAYTGVEGPLERKNLSPLPGQIPEFLCTVYAICIQSYYPVWTTQCRVDPARSMQHMKPAYLKTLWIENQPFLNWKTNISQYISFVLNHQACHAINKYKIESTLAISLTITVWTKGLMVGIYSNTMKTTFLLSFDF